MNIQKSASIFMIIVAFTESCVPLFYPNTVEEHNIINLSRWTVIVRQRTMSRFIFNDTLQYGSIIHFQAVLTLNTTFMNMPHANFTCTSSCQVLKTSKNLDNCHNRHVIKVIDVRRKAVTQYIDYNNFVILILESPFLSEKVNVINLAKSDDLIIANDNCYFYGLTASVKEPRSLTIDKYLTAAPYKFEIINGKFRNLTHVVDANEHINVSIILLMKNLYANPVICQDQFDPRRHSHIGFLNIHVKNLTFEPFELQLNESFILISQQEKIYKEINDYFNATQNKIL
ncbi:uncharacterized protein LOC130677605 [Microplitis mediator]|uniref:uncharacterized protein LOC130677605 n=1 Tax=Microplitis mediator TaxID=375433 RepID=UPI0025521D42|nr:uncharacterized protein LOC130677605 [Microplitis mediator]